MMETGWRQRLAEMAKADPRALRVISEDAGCGPNYLSELLRGKDPTVGKLLSILQQLGSPSLFYVLTGLPLQEKDVPFLRLVLSSPDDMKGPIQQILNHVAEGKPVSGLLPSDDRPIPPKSEESK